MDGSWRGYSLAERDRRWRAIRGRTERAALDCVFVPVGNSSDARYLTQLADAAVVLPTDGRPPIVVADRNSARTQPGSADARSLWCCEDTA